VLLEIDKKLT